MVHLVALEEEKKTGYELKVWHSLLVQAKVLNISSNDLLEFIYTLVPRMLACKSNFKSFGTTKNNMWVMRGFYPNSSLFMKVSILELDTVHASRFFVKVRPIDTKMSYNLSKKDRVVSVDTSKLEEHMNKNMENHLLGANHTLKPLLEEKIMMPRCLSPKGLPLFRYYKSTRKKNDVK